MLLLIDTSFCGQITLNNVDNDVDAVRDSNYINVGLALAFDSTGLGLFDAFFASLSMIMVSEVIFNIQQIMLSRSLMAALPLLSMTARLAASLQHWVLMVE